MSLITYQKYKISIDPESKKTQGLQVGDIVRRQYVDGVNTYYSLMSVLSVGVDNKVINGETKQSPFFIGALLDGDVPLNGEILDFVRTTNLFNLERSGAMYLTASDSNSPNLSVLDKLGYEKSLSFPSYVSNYENHISKDSYGVIGINYLSRQYTQSSNDNSRIFKVQRNSTVATGFPEIGFKVSFKDEVELSSKVLVSYKVRTNKARSINYTFGYTDGSGYDGSGVIDTTTEFQYVLQVIRVDTAIRNSKSYFINLESFSNLDWIEIADFNIIKLSDVTNFQGASKAIVGKISGVVDPIFGQLDDYGVYTENLYATKNANVSGTLTAGDEDGFGSTFYAGKIKKNLIPNSLNPSITNAEEVDIVIPAKVGKAFKLNSSINHILNIATNEFVLQNQNKKVTFSIWIKSENSSSLEFICGDYESVWSLNSGWNRCSAKFLLTSFQCTFKTTDQPIVCSPQLEFGDKISQYQPTDGILSDDENAYGAWMSRGGIGGTIQNPLLRFNEDGSIRSRDDNFRILYDGSAYFKGQVEIGDHSTLGGITLIKDGKIDTRFINVAEIQAEAISTETIEGMSLNFKQGTIGGWKIEVDKITSEIVSGRDHIELLSDGTIKSIVGANTKWQLNANGSGILASGNINWDTSGNAKIAGWNINASKIYAENANGYYVELNSNGSLISKIGNTSVWSLNNDGSGLFAKGNVNWDSDGNVFVKGRIEAVSGLIGGWTINATSITKNNVSLGADGSLANGNYWKLNNDGSGQLANGEIKWGLNGLWSVDKITAKSGSIGAWNIDEDSIYAGIKQTSDTYSTSGITLSSNGSLRSKQFIIKADGSAIFKGELSAATGTFSGALSAATGTFKGSLSAATGTFAGSLSAATGTFSGQLVAATGTFSGKVTASGGEIGGWIIASDALYTGTKWNGTSNWTNGITISQSAIVTYTCIFRADGSGQLADGKIKWDKNGSLTIDGSVSVNATITADQVNALTLTTTKGTIGGWTISSNSISKNSVSFGSDGTISNGSYWSLNKDGSGKLASGNITWTSAGALIITGAINATSGYFSGLIKHAFRQLNPSNFSYSSASQTYSYWMGDVYNVSCNVNVTGAQFQLFLPVPSAAYEGAVVRMFNPSITRQGGVFNVKVNDNSYIYAQDLTYMSYVTVRQMSMGVFVCVYTGGQYIWFCENYNDIK